MSEPKKPKKIDIDLEDLDDELSEGRDKITISFPSEERQVKNVNTNNRSLGIDHWEGFGAEDYSRDLSPRTGGGLSYPKAGLGLRAFAFMVDGIINYLPLFIAFFVYTRSVRDMFYGSSPVLFFISILLILAGIFWAWFYLLVRDGLGRGQSIGKKLFGLMVVRMDDNQPCTKANSAIRNLYAIGLNFIDVIIAMVHEEGRRFGDSRLNLQVIHVQDYQR